MTTTKVSLGRQTNMDGAGLELTNLATPTTSGSAVTKGYADALASGLSGTYSAAAATTGAETFTIASGSVTQIAGTTVDGVSPGVGDLVLIKDAPAATGAGSAGSTQPGNGLYRVTNATTNLTVTRADDMLGANLPAGVYVFVAGGTTNGASGWIVSTPTSNSGFVYGTGTIKFTQFSGAGEITVDSTIVKTGNQLVRAAITGDVAIGSGSNVSAIGANKVTLGMLATLAANTAIANATGSTATPTAVPMVSGPTASAISIRDANANVKNNNTISNLATTPTAAGTTTLTVASAGIQQFTGTTTQTVVLPDATTLQVGHQFLITNRSTGVVTLNANGGGLIQTLAPGSQTFVSVVTIGSAAGTWDSAYSLTSSSAISFADRETPSGLVNGSNTSYGLAHTPTAGSESVYLNGILQEPGAGNDYTISGATITYLTAPISGDKIRVNYRY